MTRIPGVTLWQEASAGSASTAALGVFDNARDPRFAGGANPTGLVDARAALAAMDAGPHNNFIPSADDAFLVSTDLTITKATWFAQGGILRPASGQTIAFAGPIIAASHRIFDTSLGGRIDLTEAQIVEINVVWFGADPTGVADSTDAFIAAWNSILGGPLDKSYRILIPPGHYRLGNLPWLSLSSASNTYDVTGADPTKLTDYCRGNVFFYAMGATFEHIGNGPKVRLWGMVPSGGVPPRGFFWWGGSPEGSDTLTETLFKTRDFNNSFIYVERARTGIRLVLMQNWNNWSENWEIGSMMRPTDAAGFDIIIEMQRGNRASLYETGALGSDGNAGEASFARGRIINFKNGARIYTILADGNHYDGRVDILTGNAETMQAHYRQLGNCDNTVMRGVKHEQGIARSPWVAAHGYVVGNRVSGAVNGYSPANLNYHAHAGGQYSLRVRCQYRVQSITGGGLSHATTEPDWSLAPNVGDMIVDNEVTWENMGFAAGVIADARDATITAASQLIQLSDYRWGGAFADTLGFEEHGRPMKFNHPIQVGGVLTYAEPVSIPAGSSGIVLPASIITPNDYWDVTVFTDDNAVFDACRIKRRLGITAFALKTLFTTGGTFAADGSDNLIFNNATGGDVDIQVRALRMTEGALP